MQSQPDLRRQASLRRYEQTNAVISSSDGSVSSSKSRRLQTTQQAFEAHERQVHRRDVTLAYRRLYNKRFTVYIYLIPDVFRIRNIFAHSKN